MEIPGALALVTGGSSGIGRGIAEALLARGARVIICGTDEPKLHDAAEALSPLGEVHARRLDVRDRAAMAELAEETDAALGGIDLLVNNAGVGYLKGGLATTGGDWDWLVDINLTGAFNTIRAFVPGMVSRDRPAHVVSTASIAGVVGTRATAYGAVKAGVVALTEGLRVELHETAVSASVLIPGRTDTNIARGHRPPSLQDAAPAVPPPASVTRLMSARDVGEATVAGIIADELFIFTHGEHREAVEKRAELLLEAVPPATLSPEQAASELALLHNPVYDELLASRRAHPTQN